MKTSMVLEKLIEFIYKEYYGSDAFKEFGEMAGSILTRFIEETGIDLGDAFAQREYLRLLIKKNWIHIMPAGNSRINSHLVIWRSIKPTLEAIEYIERKRKKGRGIFKFPKTVAEIIERGIKGLLGSYHYHRPHIGKGMLPPLSSKEGECRILK